MKRFAMMLAGPGLVVAADRAAAQIRVPGRPVTPPPTVPAPTPAPPIRIPGRPSTTTPAPTVNPIALSRRDVGVQAQCFYQLIPKLGPQRTATGFVDLTCVINGTPATKMFRFANPGEVNDSDFLKKMMDNWAAGFASIVTFSQAPVATDAKGQPVYDIYSIGQGLQSRQRVLCVAGGEFNSSSLYVASRDGSNPPSMTSWCSDGKQVVPMTFRLTDQLSSGTSAWYALNTSSPYKTIVYVVYESITGAGTPARPFLISSTEVVDMQHKSAVPLAQFGGMQLPFCNVPPDNPGSIYCTQTALNGNNYVRTQFLAYAPANLKTYWPTPPETGPGKSSPRHKKIFYTLLPGMVPPQYRGQTQGACYLAAMVRVDYEYSSGVGVGKASPESGLVVTEPMGKSSGVAPTYTDSKAPCL
jgi:hypothetical protein